MSIFHIATTGNDTTGNGSESTPWATFAKFLSSSSSGDTCIVAAGTYTLASATVATRTVQGPSADNPAVFDGAGASARWDCSGTVTITNIHFTNTAQSLGVDVIRILGSLILTGCKFSDVALNPVFGQGGVIGTQQGAAQNSTISATACVFFDITTPSSTIGTGIFACRMANGRTCSWTFTNSVIVISFGTSMYGVWFSVSYESTLVAVTLTNTILANLTGGTIRAGSDLYSGQPTYTLTTSCAYAITSGPATTITSDPLFVDAASGNFNLRPTSPCLGTGTLV